MQPQPWGPPQQPQYAPQPQAPQGWGPPAQYAPPQPAPQHYAPSATQPVAAPPPGGDIDPFHNPTRGSGEAFPGNHELEGCVIAFIVKDVDPARQYEGKPSPDVGGDLYVISTPDGQPLKYGGSESRDKPRPSSMVIQVPAMWTGVRRSGTNLYPTLAEGLGKGPVVGRMVKSTVGGKPWNLERLADDDPRRAVAIRFWNDAVMTNRFVNPVGQPLAGTPTQPIGNPYAAAQMPQPQPQPTPAWMPTPQEIAQAPTYAPPQAPQGWGQPPAQSAPSAPPAPPYGAPAPQPQYVPAAPQPAATAIPPGYESIWHGMPPADQQRVMDSWLAATGGRPNPF